MHDTSNMADGRDHQAMQKKFQDMVGNLDQLDEQLIQKVSPMRIRFVCVCST